MSCSQEFIIKRFYQGKIYKPIDCSECTIFYDVPGLARFYP